MKRAFLILIVCGLVLSGCQSGTQTRRTVRSGPPKSNAEFAKEVFQLMTEGDEAADELIDWEYLNMVGIADIGAMCRAMKSDGERERFRKGFIRGYGNSFKRSGSDPSNASNWREYSRDGTDTIIAAENPNGQVLLMTVSHPDGQQKVSKFELK